MAEMRKARHLIGGEWRQIGPEKPSINPADGKTIGSYFDGGEEAANAAIDAAFEAFHKETWRGDHIVRATAISHLADAFANRLDELVETLCLENGKLKAEARYEVEHIVRSLRFAAGLATQIFGRVLDPVPGKQSMCLRQPVGVAGLLIPWNSPGYLTIRALAPTVWTISRSLPGQQTLSLINLTSAGDPRWNVPKPDIRALHNLHVSVPVGGQVRAVHFASPDRQDLALRPLPFTTHADGAAARIAFTVPSLEYWTLIVVEITES